MSWNGLSRKIWLLQGAGRDDTPSDNMLLRCCERTNCSPAGGSTARGRTSGIRLVCLYFACLSGTGDLDSTVGIATRYSLDGPRFESRWKRDFPCRPDRPLGQPSFLCSRYRCFPGDKADGAWRWQAVSFSDRNEFKLVHFGAVKVNG